jgi:hypothetical protein
LEAPFDRDALPDPGVDAVAARTRIAELLAAPRTGA